MPKFYCNPIKLEEIIRDSGLSYKITTKSYRFTCPLCQKSDKLWMLRSSGQFRCFVCEIDRGFRGAPEWALTELLGRPVGDLREELYGTVEPVGNYLDISLEDFQEDDEDLIIEEVEEFEEIFWPYNAYKLDHRFSIPGIKYLEGRQISKPIAEQYQIRYCPETRSIVFPAYVGEKLVGWQHRIIDRETEIIDGRLVKRLKAWSSDNIPRDRILMFQNRIKRHAILCEGPFDALHCHLVSGNVCSMGKAVSQGQVAMLLRSGISKLFLALDPDAAANIEPILNMFKGEIPIYLVKIPNRYKDIGEMSLQEVARAALDAKLLYPGDMHIYFKGQETILQQF